MNRRKKMKIPEKIEPLEPIWYLSNFAKLVVLGIAFILFVKRTWVGEDAFIFFRYVDHLINGDGLVFNIGERVEGFTSPLWVFVLAAFKKITQFELRPTAIVAGLVLTSLAIALMLYFEHKKEIFFPLIVVLVITNSAFRDFATSGFETSLTFVLLVAVLVVLKNDWHFLRPEITGVLLSLLTLNRPEAALVLFYVGGLVAVKSFRDREYKLIFKFAWPVALLVGGYQIFRMGYFASLLPNTFYAKKGGTLYIAQGFNYLKDFAYSYPVTVLIYFGLTVYAFANRELRNRVGWLFVIPAMLAGYVLYAGGDYMHGRSLLMAFLAWSFVLIEPSYKLLGLYLDNAKYNKIVVQVVILLALLALGKVSASQVSYTVRKQKVMNSIEDERSRFGYPTSLDGYKAYFKLPITNELGWARRGFYYRSVSEAIDLPISVVNPNIGYFGYAAGDGVNVMSGVLVDPYLSRLKIEDRGKIGHENEVPIEYILFRKPTFSYTPFKYWNENAHYKWTGSDYADAIKDDSDDSFVPLFDLSYTEFLSRYSKLLGKDIKSEIDAAQRKFLIDVGDKNIQSYAFDINEYLGFLKVYWYPYATEQDKALFDRSSKLFGWVEGQTKYEKFVADTSQWDRTTSPMTQNNFMINLNYTVRHR